MDVYLPTVDYTQVDEWLQKLRCQANGGAGACFSLRVIWTKDCGALPACMSG